MRRSVIIIAAASCVANASWLKWTGDREPVGFMPRQTGLAEADETRGWTPKPTTAPGAVSESDAVLELLRKRATSNSFENDKTCGYTAGSSSAPLTCGQSSSCSTNKEDVVACVSGTFQPFFTVCFDYQAFQQGACSSIGPQTGCCQQSQFGACGTLLWTGSPARSMYRCFAQPTIVSMLDVPQAVVDASSRSKTSTSTSSSTSSAAPTNTGEFAGDDHDHDSQPNNTGAIVGGVVGGVGALALLAAAIAFIVLRRRRNTTKNTSTTSYAAVPPNEPHPPPSYGGPSPHMSSSSTGYLGGGGATTFPPNSPYPNPHADRSSYHAAYDAHKPGYPSPYDPSATVPPTPPSGGLFPGHHAAGPGVSPPHTPEPRNPHHSMMSELDSTPASQPAVEMGSENYR